MIDDLTQLVSILVAISIASERLVDIVKNMSTFLRTRNVDPAKEARRTVCLQVLAVVSGWITAGLSLPWLQTKVPEISGTGNGVMLVAGLGLLASGGSGFWNNILGYLNGVKKQKQAEAATAQARADRMNSRIGKTEFDARPGHPSISGLS